LAEMIFIFFVRWDRWWRILQRASTTTATPEGQASWRRKRYVDRFQNPTWLLL